MKRDIWFIYLLLIIAAGFTIDLSAQHTVAGFVSEGVNNVPVVGANVFALDLKTGSSTDRSGRFSFPIPSDSLVEIYISHIGYKDTILAALPGIELNIRLLPDSIAMESVVVTATRTQTMEKDIPQRIHIIKKESIESIPSNNTDDILKMVPGIVVNRSWGIFSRNAAVTMRGMPGSSRTLVLLDGVPLNKTAGGTVNWHLITPDELERIEVVKGPGSALYGMNAMGGVINLISKQAHETFSGTAKVGYGTYNTILSQLNFQGRDLREGKGLYWKLGGFYRMGDGYMLEPIEIQTPYSNEAYLKEGNFSGLFGYQFNPNEQLEIDYRFYEDKRGSGIKVYETDGSYETFINNNLRAEYNGYLGGLNLSAKGFYLQEYYFRQDETVNSSNEYKLVDTETEKQDMGIWLTFSKPLNPYHILLAGLDIKSGALDNEEIYRTSTDEIYTDGKLIFSAFFIQDEMNLLKNRLKLVAGLRLDFASYYNGILEVINPTDKTGFQGNVSESYPKSSWTRLSPKISAKYLLDESVSVFISGASGFMPPRLDDLSGSRKIRKGFKLANPELTPEVLNSIELGIDWGFRKKLFVKPSAFYSIGHDFQYLVATGDFIDSDSDDPVPVFQRQNVSKVKVWGVEIGMEYFFKKNIKLTGSYAYNSSEIMDYNSNGEYDLTGNVLNEVPENLIYTGFDWTNKIVNFHINYTYTDEQWFDEENTELIDSYSLVNVRLSRKIIKNLSVTLDIQDLFNDRFIDRKGYLSPGRFIMFDLKYYIH